MRKGLEQLRQINPSYLWRLLVYNPSAEKDLYSQFEDEPGSLNGMINGLNFIISTWSKKLTLDYIITLHDVAVKEVYTKIMFETLENSQTPNTITQAFSLGLRCKKSQYCTAVSLTKETLTKNGLIDLFERLAKGHMYFCLQEVSSPAKLAVPALANTELLATQWFPHFEQQRYEIVSSKEPAIFTAKAEEAITEFNQLIIMAKNDDQKRYAIAQLLHTLELVHMFDDGNCRTYGVLLLLKLLIQYDLDLGILLNPNIIDGHNIPEIARKIQEGQVFVKSIIQGTAKIPSQKPIWPNFPPCHHSACILS